MIDTHCHLNFKAFDKTVKTVVNEAAKAGVTHIIVPSSDIETSIKAVAIAYSYPNVSAAVGVHPHHAKDVKSQISNFKSQIEKMLQQPKVVAIGEVGLDKHVYEQTKYQDYHVDEESLNVQKELLIAQMQLAIKHKKTLILHCRESAAELLDLLNEHWDKRLENQTVFHCCEPNDKLLNFAIKHHFFIGVDGDVTYNKEKQEFIKRVPLELLVLETDAPYLLPEPLRSEKKYPNEPKNLLLIAEFMAKLKQIHVSRLGEITISNTNKLFS